MAKITEKQAFGLIQAYYNDNRVRMSILASFVTLMATAIAQEKSLAKANASEQEIEAEAFYALLETFHDCHEAGHAIEWEKNFLCRFRHGLRKFTHRKAFVDIGEVSIAAPMDNPEEAYIIKEQVTLVKKYLHSHFDCMAMDWFLRRYSNGERAEDIAADYGITVRNLNKRLNKMMPKVRQYMERMNGKT